MAIGIEWMLVCYCFSSSLLTSIPLFLFVIPLLKKEKRKCLVGVPGKVFHNAEWFMAISHPLNGHLHLGVL